MGRHRNTDRRVSKVLALFGMGRSTSEIIEVMKMSEGISQRTAERDIKAARELMLDLGQTDTIRDRGNIKNQLNYMFSQVAGDLDNRMDEAIDISKMQISFHAIDQKYPARTKETTGHDEPATSESTLSPGMAGLLRAFEENQPVE